MSVSEVRTSIGVKVWAMSTIYVANEVLRAWFEIANLRGLDNDYLSSNLETISRGLQTWLTTRHLRRAVLEVYDPQTDMAVERWDMVFDYDSSGTGGPQSFRTEMDKLREFASRLRSLPPGCRYRVVVQLDEGALPVRGWVPTTLRSVDHLRSHNLGGFIDTAKIKVGMEYWSGDYEGDP